MNGFERHTLSLSQLLILCFSLRDARKSGLRYIKILLILMPGQARPCYKGQDSVTEIALTQIKVK